MAQKSLLASRASVRRLCCARGNLLRGQSSPESDLCVDCAAQGEISCVASRRRSWICASTALRKGKSPAWPVVAGVRSVRRLRCARANLLRGRSSPAMCRLIRHHLISCLCVDCAAQGRISCVAGCCRSHVPHLAAGSVRRLRCGRGNLLLGRSSPEPCAASGSRICASTALRKGESLAWPVVAGASCMICPCWLKNAIKRYMMLHAGY